MRFEVIGVFLVVEPGVAREVIEKKIDIRGIERKVDREVSVRDRCLRGIEMGMSVELVKNETINPYIYTLQPCL